MNDILGVILAGGKSSRMGYNNKALIKLNGITLLDRVINRANNQVSKLVISSNGNWINNLNINHTVIEDSFSGYLGPLSGIFSTMEWVNNNEPKIKLIVTFSVDTPFFPTNLVKRLKYNLDKNPDKELCFASYDNHTHPVFGLWNINYKNKIRKNLIDGKRSIQDWVESSFATLEKFPIVRKNPFLNINTYEDLSMASDLLSKE